MKIGIVTIHSAYNYGSALQAVATCEAVNRIADISAEIIDYQPDDIMEMYSLELKKNLKNTKALLKYLLTYRSRISKKQAFELFWRNVHCLSAKCYTTEEQLAAANNEYDGFILGSDQVWNPDIVKSAFPVFCLDFVDKKKVKLSYASSFGVKSIERDKLDYLNHRLEEFEAVSVREDQAKSLLSDVNQHKTTVVCDPVFLLSKEAWAEKVTEFPLPKEYILVYCVEQDKTFREKIKKIGAKLGLAIVDIGTSANPRNYVGIHSDNVGPAEFLYAIQHAHYIITNSFHGTAFSIIFEKEFIVKAHTKRGLRMENLLERVNLKNRLVSGNETVDELIDHLQSQSLDDKDHILFDDYIQESEKYLLNTLMRVTKNQYEH